MRTTGKSIYFWAIFLAGKHLVILLSGNEICGPWLCSCKETLVSKWEKNCFSQQIYFCKAYLKYIDLYKLLNKLVSF